MSIKLMLLNHPASEIILSWKKKNFFNLYFVTIKYVTWERDYNYVHN